VVSVAVTSSTNDDDPDDEVAVDHEPGVPDQSDNGADAAGSSDTN